MDTKEPSMYLGSFQWDAIINIDHCDNLVAVIQKFTRFLTSQETRSVILSTRTINVDDEMKS